MSACCVALGGGDVRDGGREQVRERWERHFPPIFVVGEDGFRNADGCSAARRYTGTRCSSVPSLSLAH